MPRSLLPIFTSDRPGHVSRFAKDGFSTVIRMPLDREDAAANDINEFASASINNFNIRFHCINTNQVNYIGNSSETQGIKRLFSTNLIIKYDYHSSNIYNNG